MACCCKTCTTEKSQTSCLGRCGLPKHKCIKKRDLPPGPVPPYYGWLYTAKDAPKHQLRCGWRPGHIYQPVLRQMEQQRCMASCCAPCPRRTSSKPCRPTCGRPICPPRPSCRPTCPSKPPCQPIPPYPPCSKTSCLRKGCSKPCCNPCPSNPCCLPSTPSPLIRIIRRNGQYTICTQPPDLNTSPSGPNPLKYVLNLDQNNEDPEGEPKYSIEAKFNENQFDFTSSQSSFVLDFTPPTKCDNRCQPPCSISRPACSGQCLQCPK